MKNVLVSSLDNPNIPFTRWYNRVWEEWNFLRINTRPNKWKSGYITWGDYFAKKLWEKYKSRHYYVASAAEDVLFFEDEADMIQFVLEWS